MEHLEKLPPQALDMECSVLGAMLIDREAALACMEMGLHPEDFYKGAHRVIYQVACEVFDRTQELDQAILREELAKREQLEEVGGVAYLADLAAAVATSAHVRSYARHVMDRADAREVIRVGTDMVRDAFQPGQVAADLIERAEQSIFALARDRSGGAAGVGAILQEIYNSLEASQGKGGVMTGLASGYRDLDELTGGLQPGELTILAGRPSTGKSSLGLNIATRAALERGAPVGIFSLEMTREQLSQNLACLAAQVDGHRMRRGMLSREEWGRLNDRGIRPLKDAPIFVDDCLDPSLTKLRARARRLVQSENARLLVFDYLQLIRGPESEAAQSRQQEVAAVSRGLKALARELGVPVLALCQLNRSLEERTNKRPQLSDLRESGAIEQDADCVLLIHRPGLYLDPPKRDDPVTLIVAKNRNGPVGDIQLTFLERCFRFEDYVPQEGDGYFKSRYSHARPTAPAPVEAAAAAAE